MKHEADHIVGGEGVSYNSFHLLLQYIFCRQNSNRRSTSFESKHGQHVIPSCHVPNGSYTSGTAGVDPSDQLP